MGGKNSGRSAGFKHSEKTRQKIKVSNIITRLQKFVEGDESVKMSTAQVNAAKLLLDKTLPSLTMSDIQTQDVTERSPQEMYDELIGLLGSDVVNQMFPDFKDVH